MALSVDLQPRDSGYIQLGTQQDGGFGVVPDSIEYSGDLSEYGCLEATFRLKLNPRWPRAIVEQFTPCVIRDGDEHVWSGRVIAVPSTFAEDGEVVVQSQGWGQHLKDDCTDREWVISDLSRFTDGRSHPDAALGNYNLNSAVTIDRGHITFSAGKGQEIRLNSSLGEAVLDVGPNNVVKRVVITYTTSNNWGAGCLFFARTSSTGTWTAGADPTSGLPVNPIGAGGTYAGTFATGGRYLILFPYWNAATVNAGADVWVKITDIQVYTDAADESGNASALKASTVISETIDAVAPLISSDRSKISTTSLNIPNFPGSPGYRYGNELIDLANSYHGYVARLTPDPVPVFEFSAQPTDYSFVVGAGEYQLAEPAAQDGRTVYGRVISEYEDSAGVRGEAIATVPTAGTQLPSSDITITNPSFTVDATGWTTFFAASETFARSTAQFDSTPASGLLDGGGGTVKNSTYVQAATTGTAIAGRTYQLSIALRITTPDPSSTQHRIYFGDVAAGDYTPLTASPSASATWQVFTGTWVPTANRTSVVVRVYGDSGAGKSTAVYIDSLSISSPNNSLVDRRGFKRTALRPMNGTSNSGIATALAQLNLDASQYPPFKGTLKVTGRIRTKGGGSQPVTILPSRVGDAILIENLADPNTGALGRQGIIQTARYNEKTGECELTIDDPRSFVDQLNARLALAIGR